MEDEISCNDPQFMNMLETCLRVEIETAKKTLSNIESEIKEYKTKVHRQLQSRKQLKQRIKNARENAVILNATLIKQNKYINEMSDKIELMNLSLDNDYKIMKMECKWFEDIYGEYEKTWQDYHARYEEFPLAKVRREAKIQVEKLRVDRMVIEYKINELQKISKQKEQITWLRMRGKIVEMARAISNGMKLDRTLKDLNKSIEDRREELNAIDAELASRMKKQEEEKRNRALKLLEMPPPRINFSYMRTIYGHREKTGFLDGWKRNYENSIDTLSVNTVVLEEMCMDEENSMQKLQHTSEEVQDGRDRSPRSELMESRSLSLQQDQEEVEHNDAASEMDENVEQGTIDAVDEGEAERRTDEELEQEHLEEAVLPPSVFKDKQTVQRSEDRALESEDPVAKRMKLISDEEKAVASPASKSKAVRVEKKRSLLADPFSGPRITKIEAVRYNVSPMERPEKGGLNPTSGLQGSQLAINQVADKFPELQITEAEAVGYNVSPPRKLDQDNLNPSSMFTPGHYGYPDDSNLSFCVDNNMDNLKADQISLCEGSIRDFCGCSNVSPLIEDTEMAPAENNNTNAPSTSKAPSFPRNYGNFYRGFILTLERQVDTGSLLTHS